MKQEHGAAAMGQHGCFRSWYRHHLSAVSMILCWLLLLGLWPAAQAAGPDSAIVPCPGKPSCVMLVVDGTNPSLPPMLRDSMTNTSINEIVLAGNRYALRPAAWAVYTQQQPFLLKRNLTIRGLQDWPVMDFNLIEKRVLIAPGVTLTLRDLTLSNVRKLGGFGLDFFMGESGSMVILRNINRVKPACQLASDVYVSAQTFKRVSPAFPPNNVTMLPKYCFNAALTTPEPSQNCFVDALHFETFSLVASYYDPDKGSPYPGYILFQINTTRVCQATITKQCLQESNGDEELCMAMLVAAAGTTGVPTKNSGYKGGSGTWSPGAAAGIAVAGAVTWLGVFLLVLLRRKLLRLYRGKDKHSKQQADDIEQGFRSGPDAMNASQPYITSYTGNMTISQLVTLNTLLGAGSFGRVYKGRWHSSDVAVKIITVRAPEELPKVLHEAEVMMQLDHPNIVRAFHASLWNPTEQAKGSQGKRTNSSCSDPRPVTAAAAAGAAADSSDTGSVHGGQEQSGRAGRQHAPRRKRMTIQPPVGPAGESMHGPSPSVHGRSPSAHGASAGSEQHLSTPGTSHEQAQQPQQPNTSSMFAHTDSGQQAAGSGPAALPRATTSGSAASRGGHGVIGWLQVDSQQQQQQQGKAGAARVSSLSADCAPSTLADAGCRTAQQQDAGAAAGMPVPSARRSSTDTAHGSTSQPDVSSDGAFALDPQQQGAAQQQQQLGRPRTGSQQQQSGSGLRHLLPGIRKGEPGASVDGSCSSTPVHYAAAAAAPASAASNPRSGLHQETRNSGASGGSVGAVCVSSGGAAAIMHTSDLQNATGGSSKLSGAMSWGGTGGSTQAQDGEQDKKTQSEQQVWIILELCTGGTLLDAALAGTFKPTDVIVDRQPRTSGHPQLEMAKLLSRLLDAANGMVYLHSKGIMHGDLKAGNVLLQHSIHGSYGQIAKISDFGLSAALLNGATHRSTASLGTITHMAPELLRNGRMSPSADVYAFGILMWEVFCGKQAWHGLHYGVVVERVVIQGERPVVPEDMPEELVLLMRRCWDADPTKRPSFEQIVECLELLLDNLGSEEGDASGTVEVAAPAAYSRGASAPAAPPAQQQQAQPAGHRLSAPAALPAVPQAAGPSAAAAAAAVATAAAPAQPPVPEAAPAAAHAAWLFDYPSAGGAGISENASPSTPQADKQLAQGPGPYESCVAWSGAAVLSGGVQSSGVLTAGGGAGAGGSQLHSSSSAPRSSTSGNPHSSHHTPLGTRGKLPSVLDENAYLQDL